MSNDLIALLFWLFGWLLLSIGFFVYKTYIDKSNTATVKLNVWRSFWNGALSWIGILFFFIVLVVASIILINDWIEDKLS